MDIYFTEEYGKTYEFNREGRVEKYEYKCEFGEVSYIFLKREIPIRIDENIYYDIATPYGYGGPLLKPIEKQEKLIESFQEDFKKYCKENKIVSEFIRFHPLLKNHTGYEKYMDINLIGNTIYLDTDSKASIEKNLHRSCKKAIRKAEKLNLELKIYENGRNLDEFIEVYTETMRNNGANEYYLFSKNYFNDLFKFLGDKVKIFSTYLNGKITASCLVLIGDIYLHAHLAGSNKLGYETSSMNYIYYKIAEWGAENGFEKLHLGGGYGGNESSLYKFKKTFNINTQLEFYIGKNIYDREIYKKLNDKYEEKNENKTNSNLNYFPLYRR